MMFQQCGGAIIKLGQMLALRADVVSVPLAFELLNLLEHMPSVSTDQIRVIIAHELGAPVENLFPWFEEIPLAVASFAQVHRAQLSDGRIVIVKVQKPMIAHQVAEDLEILAILAKLSDMLIPRLPISTTSLVKEFSEWTLRELDYEMEARNVEFFRQQNNRPEVHIPEVIWDYTTSRVLTEEYIEGSSMAELVQQPSHPTKALLAQHLITTSMRQYFLLGYFHADPHAGNILVDDKGRLNYVDFGMVGSSGPDHRVVMASFIYHTINRNFSAAIKAFLALGFSRRTNHDLRYFATDKKFLDRFTKNITFFERVLTQEFINIAEPWLAAIEAPGASFAEKSSAKSFLTFLNIAKRHRVVLDQEITLFVKTLVAVDAISLQLDPHFNLITTLNNVFAGEEFRWLLAARNFENLSIATLPLPAMQLKNPEKAVLLKDYYTDWLGELLSTQLPMLTKNNHNKYEIRFH
ncbi:MAG: AarF/UbiB family protein [Patescibacteria group bacterium]